MQMYTTLSLLVAFAGILVSASPIANPSPSNTPYCPSGKPFTGQAGCSQCSTVGNIVCGRDEDRVTDLICTDFGTSLIWVPIDNPDKCGVVSPPKKSVDECPSGKPFTGQAGCSQCSTVGNIVCGRDEDRITDLICTDFGTSLTWVPVDNPDKCGVVSPPKETVDGCPSGKPFDKTRKSCNMCAVEGNIVCGLDGHMKADLKCTKVAGSLIWVAVDGHGCEW